MSGAHDRRVPWPPPSQKRVQTEADEAHYLPTEQQAGKIPLWDSTETVLEMNLKKPLLPFLQAMRQGGLQNRNLQLFQANPDMKKREDGGRLQSALPDGQRCIRRKPAQGSWGISGFPTSSP